MFGERKALLEAQLPLQIDDLDLARSPEAVDPHLSRDHHRWADPHRARGRRRATVGCMTSLGWAGRVGCAFSAAHSATGSRPESPKPKSKEKA